MANETTPERAPDVGVEEDERVRQTIKLIIEAMLVLQQNMWESVQPLSPVERRRVAEGLRVHPGLSRTVIFVSEELPLTGYTFSTPMANLELRHYGLGVTHVSSGWYGPRANAPRDIPPSEQLIEENGK